MSHIVTPAAVAGLTTQEKIDRLMTGCFPRPGTVQLVKLFKRSSLKCTASALGRVGAVHGSERLRSAAEQIQAGSFMHPAVALLGKQAPRVLQRHGLDALESAVDQLLQQDAAFHARRENVEDVELPGGGYLNWAEEGIAHQGRQLLADLGDDQGWVLGSPLAASAAQQIARAEDVIAAIWPEVAEQHRLLLTRVVFFSAQSFWSSSDPWTFGAIYINPQPHWSLSHYVETLLHEIGHHALMMFETVAPLVRNGTHRVRSPLRKDQRPIRGVLHAAFVLTRMAEGLVRLSEARLDELTARAMAKLNVERLHDGLSTLESEADLTHHGERLVQEMRAAWASARERAT